MKLYRPATVLVGVLFILLGGLTRLATPDHVYEKQNMEVVHGTIGEKLPYGDSSVTITRMKFGKTVLESGASEDDEPIETDGVFIALEWDAVRGVTEPLSANPTLRADGGTIYRPLGVTESGVDFPDPGFAQIGAVVFEVNPSDLKGLTLRLDPAPLYNVLYVAIDVDLGIPSEDVAQRLVDGAAAQYVFGNREVRVA